MNAIYSSQGYSCAVDSFLEVSSYVFLPYLSNVPLRNEFTELLFKACSQYVSSNGSSRLFGQIGDIWGKTVLLSQLEIAMLASARFLKKKHLSN